MNNFTHLAKISIITATLLALVLPLSAGAESGTVTLEVDGTEVSDLLGGLGETVELAIGESSLSSQVYLVESFPPGTGPTSLSGALTLLNASSETKNYEIILMQPLDAPRFETTLQGSLTISLTTDHDGGRISCSTAPEAGPSIYLPQVDEQLAHDEEGRLIRLFDCPFALTASGPAQSNTSALLDETLAPDALQSFGVRYSISLTPGDSVRFSGSLELRSTHEACAADIDGDGEVSVTDLLALLGLWGPIKDTRQAAADLNGDGVVDQLDLLALLGSWGQC